MDLDAKDGSILYEVPPCEYKMAISKTHVPRTELALYDVVCSDGFYKLGTSVTSCDVFHIIFKCFRHSGAEVKFKLSADALKTLQAAADAATPFEVKASGKAKAGVKVYMTEQDFKQSAQGSKNITKFVEALRLDFDKIHYPLVDEDGKVEIRIHPKSSEKTKVEWAQLLSRIPGYFTQLKKEMKDKTMSLPACGNLDLLISPPFFLYLLHIHYIYLKRVEDLNPLQNIFGGS